MIIDLAVTIFGLAITYGFDYQSCTLSMIYSQLLQKDQLYVGCKHIASYV
jgi:hypothetical protein